MPLAAAASALMLAAAVEDMLFRRVALCAGFMEPTDSECACGRDLGSEPATLEECRCWLVGRTVSGSCLGNACQWEAIGTRAL
jgi:hypothetical protein